MPRIRVEAGFGIAYVGNPSMPTITSEVWVGETKKTSGPPTLAYAVVIKRLISNKTEGDRPEFYTYCTHINKSTHTHFKNMFQGASCGGAHL